MIRDLICIQCPKGCGLSAEIKNGKVSAVSGNRCPRGAAYAKQEIEAPMRVLTSSVLAEGLELKMLPVKTSGPIPKNKIMEAMSKIKKIKVTRPVASGETLVSGFMGLNVNLVASRSAKKR